MNKEINAIKLWPASSFRNGDEDRRHFPARLLGVLLFSALLLGGSSGLAQDPGGQTQPAAASLEGAVTITQMEGQPEPLSEVRVMLTSTSPGAQPLSADTDANGHYQFTNLTPGVYTIQATLEGFQPFTKSTELKAGQDKIENIGLTLERLVQNVEVQDKATSVATQQEDSTATLSTQQITALPLAEQKFDAALPLVPGIVRTKDGLLNFKGAPENQGVLLVDSAQTVDPVTGSFSIPIPLDVIQTLNAYKTPYNSEYGGFSGGLTVIETKPPSNTWHYGIMDFVPGFRGKSGHVVGISSLTPRLFFGGPVIKNKLNFSEAFTYDVRKAPIRGLAWPYNETKRQGFDTLTSLQAVISPQHLFSISVNGFSNRKQFADIDSLVPQTASSDDGQKGASIGITDSRQFASGALLSTMFHYTRFDSNAHGQGPSNMLITPEGWGGNYFNAWMRTSNHFELLPSYQFSPKEWLGRHQVKVGVDFTHRSYDGDSLSHPVQVLRQDGSLAEQIDFLAAGRLKAKDTEVAEFVQDHWKINEQLSLDLGGRLSSQTIGRSAAFAPRGGITYVPGHGQKTVIRAGAGIFYDTVPMLAADFTANPTRVVSFYDPSGALSGSPVVFENAYVRRVSGGGYVQTGPDLDSSARNFTWNFEVDREIRRNLALRASYLYSQTQDLYIVTPITGAAGAASLLGLAGTGGSHYHELETTLHYRLSDRGEFNVSYVRSRARGDLNALSTVFTPFEQPVIQPNVMGNFASDVPNRMVSWGAIPLPGHLTLSPVVDVHSGLPYSKIDVLQNYVGAPNSHSFPTFFSLDVRLYHEFPMHVPFFGNMKNRKLRLGLYTLNLTNHANTLDVYNNATSPYFGHFVGFQHRVDGFVIDVVN